MLLVFSQVACNQANQSHLIKGKKMEVNVVHLDGCSATPKTILLVEKVADDLGIKIHLESIAVRTQNEAGKYRHIGSPTVQINGLDIDPGARDVKQFGLS